GCGGVPPIGMASTVEPAPLNQLPPPIDLGVDGSFLHRLGALDAISIELDGMADSLREVVVDGEGMSSYPLAGSVQAAGLTTTELARDLEDKMRANHVRDPRVSVNMVQAVSNVVTVDGQVNKPGLYPIYRNMTLSQTVAMASGETDVARTSVVLI